MKNRRNAAKFLTAAVFLTAVTGQLSAFESRVLVLDTPVTVSAEEPGSLFIFDQSGTLIPNLEEITAVEAGWIVQTGSAGFTLQEGNTGTFSVSPYALLSLESLEEGSAELFLLQGALRYAGETDYKVTMQTTAAEYRIGSPGDYILSLDDMEEFHVLEGSAEGTNFLTGNSFSVSETVRYLPELRSQPLAQSDPIRLGTLRQLLPIPETAAAAETPEEPEPEVVETAAAEPEPQPEPEIKETAAAEPEPEVVETAAAEPESQPEPETKETSEAEPEPEVVETAAAEPEPQPEPEIKETAAAEPEPEPEVVETATAEPEPAEQPADTGDVIIAVAPAVKTDAPEEPEEPVQLQPEESAAAETEQEETTAVPAAPEGTPDRPSSQVIVISQLPPSDIAGSQAARTAAENARPVGFGLDTEIRGAMTAEGSFSVHLALSPYLVRDRFTLGLTFPAAYDISSGAMLLPRGNSMYDFGTGYTSSIGKLISFTAGFAASRDFYLDILSYLDSLHYESAGGAFTVRADSSSLLSLGTGELVPRLDPALDQPFVRRTGLTNTLKTRYFNYNLIINDISHAELFGLRLAAKPFGMESDLELGLYGLADISLQPENRFILVPGLDISYRFSNTERLKLSAYIDFSMLMLASSDGFHTESFSSGGSFYNYLAAAKLQGQGAKLRFSLGARYQNGLLRNSLFGWNYPWLRADFADSLFDDDDYTAGKDVGGRWQVSGDLGWNSSRFATSFGYTFALKQDFSLLSWTDPFLDEIRFSASYTAGSFSAAAGLRQHGFIGLLMHSEEQTLMKYLFNEQTVLYGEAAYQTGSITARLRVSGTAQYLDPPDGAALNNIDNFKLTSSNALEIIPAVSLGLTLRLGGSPL
jgi:hypothetical protein